MFGNLLFLHRFFLLLLLFLLLFSLRFCPTKFSETDNPIFTKLHWKVDPHLQKVHSGLGIFKMAANIKIQKIVKNSKMKRFQWKWIFTGSKTCCTILWPFRFAMAAIWNPKWPSKYKNPQILGKILYYYRHDSKKLGSNYFLLCSHTILHSYH